MPCYSPLKAYRSKEIGENGKRGVTFDRNSSFAVDLPLYLPCGQCVGCRLNRAAQWAIRCTHENKSHAVSSFITLTYDDDNLPLGMTLVKDDLQLFLKRLHNRLLRSRGYGIRYYACGEYGEITARPHYHAIVFGYDFPDKEFFKRNGRGEELSTSRELRSLWPMGHNSIGSADFDAAAYVAGYVVKKITGDAAADHYIHVDASGQIFERVPEFSFMSKRPGIGYDWFLKYGRHAYNFDSVIMNGREITPPRFYDDKLAAIDTETIERIKNARSRVTAVRRAENMVDRLIVREKVAKARLALRKRDVT